MGSVTVSCLGQYKVRTILNKLNKAECQRMHGKKRLLGSKRTVGYKMASKRSGEYQFEYRSGMDQVCAGS